MSYLTFNNLLSGTGYLDKQDAVYANAHDAAAADSGGDDATQGGASITKWPPYEVLRHLLAFDTSKLDELGIANITQVDLELYSTSGGEDDVGQGTLHVVEGIQSIPIDLADFGPLKSQVVSGGSIVNASIPVADWYAITLNATGRGWINKPGVTKLALRVAGDIDNDTPTGMNAALLEEETEGSNLIAKLTIYFSESQPAILTTDVADLLLCLSARLNGTLSAGGDLTWECGFEYGLTDSLGTRVVVDSLTAPSSFSHDLTGLAPNTTYYFHAFATYSGITYYGDTTTLTTPALPAITPYMYAGLDEITPGYVSKVNLDTLIEEDSIETVDLVWSLAKKNGFLYAGQWSSPAQIARINLSSFAIEDSLTLGVSDCRAMLVYLGYLYAGLWPDADDDHAQISKIDLDTFSEEDSLDYNYTNVIGCRSLVRSGDYLYGALFGSVTGGGTGYVAKVNLLDFSKVSELTLTNNGAIAIATDDTYLYVGHYLSPAKITRIDLSTFTEKNVLTFAVGENKALDMLIYEGFLYVGLETDAAKVVKIDLSTFTKDSVLDLTGEVWCEALQVVGDYLYAGTVASGVVKIDLETFTVDDSLAIASGVDSLYPTIAPTVTTDPTTRAVLHRATLNGTLDDDVGEDCECGFEWGETTAYENTTATQTKNSGETFSQVVTGLKFSKTYHFRAFATDLAVTGYGVDRTFKIRLGGDVHVDQLVFQRCERMQR